MVTIKTIVAALDALEGDKCRTPRLGNIADYLWKDIVTSNSTRADYLAHARKVGRKLQIAVQHGFVTRTLSDCDRPIAHYKVTSTKRDWVAIW